MQHDEFIGQVQHRAHLPSRGDAERITRIVLELFAERLPETTAHKLAAQLPSEIGRHLIGATLSGKTGLHEFFQGLSLRESIPMSQATHHARAVMSVIRDAVSPGAIAHVLDQMPEEFGPLLTGGAEGKAPWVPEAHR